MITKDVIIRELQEFYKERGFVPSVRRASQYFSFSGTTAKKRFGSWNKALIAAEIPVNRDMTLYTVLCAECGKSVQKSTTEINRNKHHFCDRSCAARFNNRRRKRKKKVRYCLLCGKPVRNKYCGPACQHAYHQKIYIERWLEGKETGSKGSGDTLDISKYVRRYLLEQANYQCTLCGWSERNVHTDTIPLEIDHIDGDWKNNSPDNLRVLCPNCHALTPTYRGANRGNGSTRKYCGGRGSYWKDK